MYGNVWLSASSVAHAPEVLLASGLLPEVSSSCTHGHQKKEDCWASKKEDCQLQVSLFCRTRFLQSHERLSAALSRNSSAFCCANSGL